MDDVRPVPTHQASKDMLSGGSLGFPWRLGNGRMLVNAPSGLSTGRDFDTGSILRQPMARRCVGKGILRMRLSPALRLKIEAGSRPREKQENPAATRNTRRIFRRRKCRVLVAREPRGVLRAANAHNILRLKICGIFIAAL
jgi:hypothetical protein